MSRYADAVRRAGHARWFAWVGSRVAPRLDRFLYRRFGGRITASGRHLPTMLLTTTGRRTGQGRTSWRTPGHGYGSGARSAR
jgi:F420H(2)-dependent quinone reductase